MHMPKSAPKTKAKKITIQTTALSAKQKAELLSTLEERFTSNTTRHKNIKWEAVAKRISSKSKKLLALYNMEQTGGEPDVVYYDKKSDVYYFADCSTESPKRRSVCYDKQARTERKKFPPQTSAEELAQKMGAELLTEEEYYMMQEAEEFDTTTSSWLATPKDVRKHGGAIFGDRRYDRVFIYHNGADSYYAARGFRCKLTV